MTGVTRVTRGSGSGSGDEVGRGGGYRLSRSVNCHARLVRAPVKSSHAAGRDPSGGWKLTGKAADRVQGGRGKTP